MHVQSCCFAYKTYCFFLPSRRRPRRWILKSLLLIYCNYLPLYTRELLGRLLGLSPFGQNPCNFICHDLRLGYQGCHRPVHEREKSIYVPYSIRTEAYVLLRFFVPIRED